VLEIVGIDNRCRWELEADDEMYVREMYHFLQCAKNGEQTMNTLEDAANVLDIALEAKGT
jgi:hypothetical protein